MSIKVFISYAHADQELHKKLHEHLGSLERLGKITVWQDREIPAGADWEHQINTHLNEAGIILLLVSPSYITSKYCWNKEVQVALRRHEAGTARVIPIVLRPTDWQHTPLGQLQALPTEGKPVAQWEGLDAAFEDVVRGIRRVVEDFPKPDSPSQPVLPSSSPRSSVLHLPNRRSLLLALVGGLVATGGVVFYLSRQESQPTTLVSSPHSRILYHTVSPNFGVNVVTWSPNGDSLVSVDGDHTVSVLDSANGTRLITYRKHSKNVNAAVWSPNGAEIASASSDKTVQIWNAKSGNTRLVYQAPASVWIVDWSPDGKYVASAGANNTTQVWDANTRQLITTCQGPTDGIWAVAWSRDGERIASGYTDGTVQICSARDGHLILTYHGQFDTIYEVMWSHHHDTILSASVDHTVHVWNAANGTFHLAYSGHSTPIRAAEWSPDDTLIASADKAHIIQIWDTTTGKTLYTCHGHTDEVSSVSWSPDGKQLASSSNDGTIRIWDIK